MDEDRAVDARYSWWRHRPTDVLLLVEEHGIESGEPWVTGAVRPMTEEEWLSDPAEFVWEDTQDFAREVQLRRGEFEVFGHRPPAFDALRQKTDETSDLGALGWT